MKKTLKTAVTLKIEFDNSLYIATSDAIYKFKDSQLKTIVKINGH